MRSSFSHFHNVNVDNFPGQLQEIWRNPHRGGSFSRDWEWLVLVQCTKPASNRPALRTSQQMITAARNEVVNHFEQKNENIGELETTYLANTIARMTPADTNIDEISQNPTQTHEQIP